MTRPSQGLIIRGRSRSSTDGSQVRTRVGTTWRDFAGQMALGAHIAMLSQSHGPQRGVCFSARDVGRRLLLPPGRFSIERESRFGFGFWRYGL
jgi:hypothetical protein